VPGAFPHAVGTSVLNVGCLAASLDISLFSHWGIILHALCTTVSTDRKEASVALYDIFCWV